MEYILDSTTEACVLTCNPPLTNICFLPTRFPFIMCVWAQLMVCIPW